MNLYQHYSPARIFMRRAAVLLIGALALPVMLFRADRAKFYSYLHRMWVKTSDKPVWLAQAEAVTCDFY